MKLNDYDAVCDWIRDSYESLTPFQAQEKVENLSNYEDRLGAMRYYYALCDFKTILCPKGAKRIAHKGDLTNPVTNAERIRKLHAPPNDHGRKAGPKRGEEYNLAILTGPGSGSLIDIDVKGGTNGYVTLKGLTDANGELQGWWTAQTPSGGYHYWKRHRDGFRTTVGSEFSGLGDAIDTRGPNKKNEATQIGMAYPSRTANGRYLWTADSAAQLTEVEDWVLQQLARKVKPRKVMGRGSEGVTEEDLESFDLEDFLSALEAIDPDELDYAEWLHVGFACKDAEDRSPRSKIGMGYEWWDSWSQRGDRYTMDEVAKRWDGIDNGVVTNGITVATVFWLAKERFGWASESKAKILSLNERYAFVIENNQVVDLEADPTWAVMQLSEFRNTMKKEGKKLAENWLESEARKDVRDIGYSPGGPRIYEDSFSTPAVRLYNRFSIPAFVETTDISLVHVFIDHIQLLMPRTDDRELFLDWLAITVNEPRRRSPITPLLIAQKHGVGRGWVTKLLEHLIGPDNCKQTEMDILAGQTQAGQYHDYLHEALLVTIHETKLEGKKQFAVDHHIRDKLTNDRFQMNLKYGRNAMHWVFANFLLYSNYRDAMAIPSDDRRIWVTESNHNPGPGDSPYYIKLYGALNDPNFLRQVWWYLYRRKWQSFNWSLRAPMTPEKQVMIEGGRGTVEQAFMEFLDDPTTGDCFTFHDLLTSVQNVYTSINGDDEGWSKSAFNHMKKAKCVRWQGPDSNMNKKLKVGGTMQAIWIVRNTNKWLHAPNDITKAEVELAQKGMLAHCRAFEGGDNVVAIPDALLARKRDDD